MKISVGLRSALVVLLAFSLAGCASETRSADIDPESNASSSEEQPSDTSPGGYLPDSLTDYSVLSTDDIGWSSDFDFQPQQIIRAIDDSECVTLQNAPLADLFATVSGKTTTYISSDHNGLISGAVLESTPEATTLLISEIDRCSLEWPTEQITKTDIPEGTQYTAPFRDTGILATMIIRPGGDIVVVRPNVTTQGSSQATELLDFMVAATQ
jgi:hypothetical protein